MEGQPDLLVQLQAQLQVQQEMMLRQDQQMQQIQAQFADTVARMHRAEEERSLALKLAAKKSDDLVDSKGVGQPFKFSGKQDQDFAEWQHKFRTFMKAKYGHEVDKVLNWASRQRKTIVRASLVSEREVSWSSEFGDAADLTDQVDGVENMVAGLMAYLVSFTTGEANKVVRNSGTDGFEAWRRLTNEFDPTSAMRRVVILGMVQNPPKCQRIEDLGPCLEDWLSKKRQYEEYTDGNGDPCKVSDDSLMAGLYKLMPESLEEAVMFKSDEFSNFETLFDRLSSFATVRHSVQLSRRDLGGSKPRAKDPNAMDIGAVTKGKGKGKSKDFRSGFGKGNSNKMTCHNCGKLGHKASECREGKGGKGGGKGNKRMDSVQCWNCFQYGHYGKDCWMKKTEGNQGNKGKGKSPGKKGKAKGGQANSVENAQPEKEPELSHLDLCPLEEHRSFVAEDGERYVEIPIQEEQEAEREASGSGGTRMTSSTYGVRQAINQITANRMGPMPPMNPPPGWAAPGPVTGSVSDPSVSEVAAGVGPRLDASRSRTSSRRRERSRSRSVVDEDVDHNSMNTEQNDAEGPAYVVNDGTTEWIKVNYDSGAVSTVIPVEMAVSGGLNLRRVGDYRVANGEKIPRYGQVRVPCEDQQGNRRGFKATVTHVHKPLGSAGEFSRSHDAYIFEDGGFLVPKNNIIAVEIKNYLSQLLEIHGEREVLKMYKEGNLYNIYLKQTGALRELNALDSGSEAAGSPNERQVEP